MDGLLVVDLTANVAGPLACQVLCDLGADVIKVEPRMGEAARRITATVPGFEHVTPYFSPNNRGKKSVRLDPGEPADAEELKRLITVADVVVQGMRPGTMERHGLGPSGVAELNPGCVYVSISAYGGGSDLEDRPGIDMIVQAEAGCLSGQPAGRPPRLIPFQVIDGATGHVVAQAVLATLVGRPELAADPRFADQAARSCHAAELRTALTEILLTRTTEDWVALFSSAGLMAARVASWRDVVESELFARRRLRLPARQEGREIDVVRTPAVYSGFVTTLATEIPAAGAHDGLLAGAASGRRNGEILKVKSAHDH
jgi:crotonobetainyl-CoA:carnitine CoA-transferase CaiB-like acyl-CoA transferase